MFFDAAILEFDYHGGLMRLEQAAIVKAAIKSRGEKQGQLAEVIELSQSHLCNALKGRYPLSPAAAERLVEWMRSSA
jgi:plasmid maintenance system antidote protein VapI